MRTRCGRWNNLVEAEETLEYRAKITTGGNFKCRLLNLYILNFPAEDISEMIVCKSVPKKLRI
jgi:hypothetical protein